jgi:hypothetical protein
LIENMLDDFLLHDDGKIIMSAAGTPRENLPRELEVVNSNNNNNGKSKLYHQSSALLEQVEERIQRDQQLKKHHHHHQQLSDDSDFDEPHQHEEDSDVDMQQQQQNQNQQRQQNSNDDNESVFNESVAAHSGTNNQSQQNSRLPSVSIPRSENKPSIIKNPNVFKPDSKSVRNKKNIVLPMENLHPAPAPWSAAREDDEISSKNNQKPSPQPKQQQQQPPSPVKTPVRIVRKSSVQPPLSAEASKENYSSPDLEKSSSNAPSSPPQLNQTSTIPEIPADYDDDL